MTAHITRVAVLGATGRLGRMIVGRILHRHDVALAAAITRFDHPQLGLDAGVLVDGRKTGVTLVTPGPGCFGDADVVIDVSLPGGVAAAGRFLAGRALVVGVTGLKPADQAAITEHVLGAPALVTSNFSLGVHVLADLVGRAAHALPGYDVEVIEAHHRAKVDAPSGTALLLAQAAATARGQTLDGAVYGRHGRTGPRGGEIGIHALRMGDVVGDHQVWLAGDGDRISLGHVATSRETFAVGAIQAAIWLVGRAPGHYAMRDVLGLS